MTTLKLTGGHELELPSGDEQAARYLADVMVNRGQLPDSDGKVPWASFAETISPKNRDTVAASEITPLLQKSMEIIIREPIEPEAVITSLFSKVQAQGLNTQVLAGALGAVYAGDVQENGTYPEVMFQIGGAVSTAWIGKSGIAASFTDEALRYSTWDIMAINLRLMGNALVRHKEQKAVNFLNALGTELYNNLTPATSLFGVTTGRAIDMTGNGSMRMDDLLRAMAHMSEEGFTATTLLMNPLFFYKFVQDPVMRAMLINHGGGSYFGGWSGNPGPQASWSNGAMGGQGPTRGQKIVPGGTPSGNTVTPLTERSNRANSAFRMPSYAGINLNIITSPLVTYDPESNLGDIFLLSEGNVGFYLVDEDPTTVEWRDESVETVKVKIRERYGFAVAHEGQGVGVFKNVALEENFFNGTVQAAAVTAAAIDPATPVV